MCRYYLITKLESHSHEENRKKKMKEGERKRKKNELLDKDKITRNI